jgi:hypothetical protein
MFILSVSTPSKLGNSAAPRGAVAGRVGVKTAFWRGGVEGASRYGVPGSGFT